MSEKTVAKAKIQEEQYTFPYHFIPDVESEAIVTNRFLQWSMVYMSYISFVRDAVLQTNAQSIIDVGCGDGRMVYELEKKEPERNYLGIDISERALHFARGFTQEAKFEVFDIIERPYPEQFDACTFIETIEHIPPEQIKDMVKNIALSLRENGVLYLTTPTKNLPVSKKHFQHFDKKLIEEYVGDYFTIEEVQYFNVDNWLAKLLARFLINKLFTTNPPSIRKLVYGLYLKYCFRGTEMTGTRIYVKATKKA